MAKILLSLSDFTVEIRAPENRMHIVCLYIHEDGKFNMNGRLAQILGGKRLKVYFLETARNLALVEAEDGIAFPKSGSHKLPEAAEFLKKHKITLPAQFEVWYNEQGGFWQGDYVENPTTGLCKKRPNTK